MDDRQLILDALSDGPESRAQLMELTGIEAVPITNRLQKLKNQGDVELCATGWRLTTGEPGAETPPPPRAVCVGDAIARIPYRADPDSGEVIEIEPVRTIDWAVSERGDVWFRVIAGDKAGDVGEISKADAAALYRLLREHHLEDLGARAGGPHA